MTPVDGLPRAQGHHCIHQRDIRETAPTAWEPAFSDTRSQMLITRLGDEFAMDNVCMGKGRFGAGLGSINIGVLRSALSWIGQAVP